MKNLFNFRSFFNFLSKNKLYTNIEIFGLSVSLMFVILIGVYVTQELSIDRFHENKNRTYVLASNESFGFAYKLAGKIKDRYPEIEAVSPMLNSYTKHPVTITNNKVNADLLFADSSFFRIFSFPLVMGDRNTVLESRNYAVVSETFARKAFPGIDPLGQIIQVNDSIVLTVNGIMKDISNSAMPNGDILARIENIGYFYKELMSDSYQIMGNVPIIIMEKEGADLRAKADDLEMFVKKEFRVEDRSDVRILLVPFKEVYFSAIKDSWGIMFRQGNKSFVLILISVGILILLFSVTNYVNLTVAQAGFRAKEMATRLLLGSNRIGLFSRMILESTLLCAVSFCFGFLLAMAAVPYVNDLLQTRIDLVGFLSVKTLLSVVLLIMLTGMIAGMLPAIIISKARPIDVVKGAFRKTHKMIFSKFFITFQHVITIALVVASITMITQVNHLINAPLGYHTSNIIDVEIDNLDDKNLMLTLANEIRQQAGVKRVAFSQGMPFGIGNNHTVTHEGRKISFQKFAGDSTYFDMLGFEILRDNQLASGNGYYLSQQAFKELGISEESETFPYVGEQLVAGVIKNFQLNNIVFEARPTLLRMQKVEDFYPWNLAIEVEGNATNVLDDVKKIYEDVTGLEFTGKYIDQQIADSFSMQRKTSDIVSLFTIVALLLSVLGLVAMSTYFIQQHSLEIAIRKVFGSSNPEVFKRIITTFLSYVVIAFVIVTPFIWHIMRNWLSGYSYRIPLSPWIFISAGMFCLFISFVTVFWQSYLAANRNPVESVKRE